VVENYDPISALARLRAGQLSLRPWLASVRGADEWAWFARDDLLPFGLMCVRMGWRAATRKLPSSPHPSANGGFRYLPGRRRWSPPGDPGRPGDHTVVITQGGSST
jgi:D-aspartate ligase